MTDVLLDATGDLYWVNGETDTVSGDDELLQRLWIALSTGLGEWAFDTTLGFPYREITQTRPASDDLIKARVRYVCDRVLGDGATVAIEVTRDAATQSVTIDVDCDYGAIQVTA